MLSNATKAQPGRHSGTCTGYRMTSQKCCGCSMQQNTHAHEERKIEQHAM